MLGFGIVAGFDASCSTPFFVCGEDSEEVLGVRTAPDIDPTLLDAFAIGAERLIVELSVFDCAGH